jgi:hypothetical protein
MELLRSSTLKVRLLASITNIRLGWKGMAMANAVAYYNTATIMTIQVLMYRLRLGRLDHYYKILPATNALAYLSGASVTKEKKGFYDVHTSSVIWGKSYKTFYSHNLRFFIISLSVCPLQAFPA